MIIVEGVSNDTKDTKKKLVFNTWGVVCCTMIIVEGVSNDTKKYHDLSFAVGKKTSQCHKQRRVATSIDCDPTYLL